MNNIVSGRKQKTLLIISSLCALLAAPARAQTSGGTASGLNAAAALAATAGTSSTASGQDTSSTMSLLSTDVRLAMSTPDYRVTAGDVYTLAFAAGTQSVEYIIPVDTTYRVRVANLGMVDTSGLTFNQLKSRVEGLVTNNYPMSGVQFVLSNPARFKVYVRGEIAEAVEIDAWALSRLSSVTAQSSSRTYANLTARTSMRDVEVRSLNGRTQNYDLWKAGREGNFGQDPYLRPGDVVTFNRAARTVTVSGAVERPGTYQLLEGENLKELMLIYGSGFTPVADRSRIELVRRVNSVTVSGDKVFLNEGDTAANYGLEDYDEVTVPEIVALEPVIFVEGAVGAAAGAALTVANRLTVAFNKGENYAALVRRNRDWFSSVSDIKNAYIIRGEEHIAVNLTPMLYDADYRGEEYVRENDVLIIPFRQYFVTVAGAVRVPGRYPYIPDRDWEYYIALAGGFIPGQNVREKIVITDLQGKKLTKRDVITPETVITAETNAFLYYFNQYAPVITTVLTIITSYIAVDTAVRAYANR